MRKHTHARTGTYSWTIFSLFLLVSTLLLLLTKTLLRIIVREHDFNVTSTLLPLLRRNNNHHHNQIENGKKRLLAGGSVVAATTTTSTATATATATGFNLNQFSRPESSIRKQDPPPPPPPPPLPPHEHELSQSLSVMSNEGAGMGGEGITITLNGEKLPSRRRRGEPARLFYCGGVRSGGGADDDDPPAYYTRVGVALVIRIFPTLRPDDAVPLTRETLHSATPDDLLVYQMHQHCDGLDPAERFPGPQIHLNGEYYDIHPNHPLNLNHARRHDDEGTTTNTLTYDYLPPQPNVYVLGPHDDVPGKNLRVTLFQILLSTLHPTLRDRLLFDPSRTTRPPRNNNTARPHFLLYGNSNYVRDREVAAYRLSHIGTVHTLGKCQGNPDPDPASVGAGAGVPPLDIADRTRKYEECVPHPDESRPASIVPLPPDELRRGGGANWRLMSDYRFALVMENTIDRPGYVSEKLLGALLSGAVPIYSGPESVFDMVNRDAVVYYDPRDPREALERVERLEQDRDAYEEVLGRPIWADGDRTVERYFSFEDGIGGGWLKGRIRDMMGYDE